jgi:hypothetical protein
VPAAVAPALDAEATLRDWVRQQHVTWEAEPRRVMVDDGSLSVVGYDVHLYGRVGEALTPGDQECGAAYTRLRAIATAALDGVTGHPMCEIEGFDSSLHMEPEGDWKPEVELTIQLTHSRAYVDPGDAGEKLAAAAIEAALQRLGVRPRTRVRGARSGNRQPQMLTNV